MAAAAVRVEAVVVVVADVVVRIDVEAVVAKLVVVVVDLVLTVDLWAEQIDCLTYQVTTFSPERAKKQKNNQD